MLIKDFGTRFDALMKLYNSQQNGPNHKSSNIAMKADHHLATVEFLANYERALSRLVHSFLYNNPKCRELVRIEMERLVNRPTGHACGNFSKCLAVFMHKNLSPVHNTDQNDLSKLGK